MKKMKDLADSMNEMTMGLRNKVTNLKEIIASAKEDLELAKKNNDQAKIDEATKKLEEAEEALQAFILDKERRVRIEEDAEHEMMGPEDVGKDEEEAKEESAIKEFIMNKDRKNEKSTISPPRIIWIFRE